MFGKKDDPLLRGKNVKLITNVRVGDGQNFYRYNEVKSEASTAGGISDGYHTFDELYEHRHVLFIQVLNANEGISFKTLLNDKKESWDGWFIAGINTPMGQATYHLPIKYWGKIKAQEVEYNSDYDGHNSTDVLYRLQSLSI
jgi:hypothetical protein